MIHLSVAFRRALFENDLSYLCYADITLTNGTVINLTNDEIWQGGFEIEEAVSDDSKFAALGSTCMGSATVIFNNIDERYSSYDFTGASVVLYVAKYFADESPKRTEKIKKFTGTVDEATFGESLITLKLLDNMQLFDKPYDSTLHYPATLSSIVIDACTKCGVSLSTYDFPHKDYVVQESPDPDKTTYRDVIGWAATIAGCYAKCNRNGLLELAWFDQGTLESIKNDIDGGGFDSTTRTYYQTGDTLDGGSFNPWNDGADADQGDFDDEETLHYINQLYSQTINIDDTVITRVKISVEHESEITTTTDDGAEYTSTQNETLEYTYGTEGYTIEISGNDFIDVDQAQTVCNWLGAQLVGLTFRKATVTHKTSPSIEAGDIAVIWDRKGRQYPILVCRTTFKASGKQTTISSSETPNRNSATRYTALTKAVVDARKLVHREMTFRAQQLEQLAAALEAHSGLYLTVWTADDHPNDVDSGSIYFLHNFPTLEESNVILKMTAEGFGVSTNGGTSWNLGFTVDGDMIVRILSAVGIDADWITTGALSARDKSGNTLFKFDVATGEVWISADKFTLKKSSTGTATTTLSDYIRSSVSYPDGMDKATIIAALQQYESTPGIYMDGNIMYIRATSIVTGYLQSKADSSGNRNFVLNLDTGEMTMKKGSITLGTTSSGTYFNVTSSGALTCYNANVKGTINATAGYIGGIIIKSEYLRHGENITATNWLSMCTPYSSSYSTDAYFGKNGVAVNYWYKNGITYLGNSQEGVVYTCMLTGGQVVFKTGSTTTLRIGNRTNNYTEYLNFYHGTSWAGDVQYSSSDGALVVINTLLVTGNFTVDGAKSRSAKTEDYSKRLLYCYETPSPMFGDVGESEIGEDGLAYVFIDPIFLETINTSQYQVFLQKYGSGDCWIKERNSDYFIVEGTPGLPFGWELKAKQAGYENQRLDIRDDGSSESDGTDYADEAEAYIHNLYNERLGIEE